MCYRRVIVTGEKHGAAKARGGSGQAKDCLSSEKKRKKSSPRLKLGKKEAKEIAARERKRKAYDKKQEKANEKRRKKELKEGHRIKTGHEIYRYVVNNPELDSLRMTLTSCGYRKLELCVRLDSNLTGTDTGREVIAELDKKGFQSKIVAEDYFSQVSVA